MANNFQTESVVTPGKTFASKEASAGAPTGAADWPFAILGWGDVSADPKVVEDATGKRLPVKVADGLAAGAVVAGQISVSGAEAALSTVVARRFRIKAQTSNSDVIYVGPAGVTTANGYPLWPGDELPEVEVSNLNVIHAIVGSGTQTLCYLGLV